MNICEESPKLNYWVLVMIIFGIIEVGEMKRNVNPVDRVKSFPTSILHLLAEIGADTAENESSQVCKEFDS